MVTVLNAGATSYVLTNLNKYMRHEFFLVPFYKTIEGRPSNVKLATTLEDVPSGAPENVHVGMINVTSAFVRWSPPPKSTQNGQLIGYKVKMLSADKNLVKISLAPCFVFRGSFHLSYRLLLTDSNQEQQQQQDPRANVFKCVNHVGYYQ